MRTFFDRIYYYQVNTPNEQDAVKAIDLFYATRTGPLILNDIPVVTKGLCKRVDIRIHEFQKDSPEGGEVNPHNVEDELALFYPQYTIDVRAFSYDGAIVYMAEVIYHEFLHIWFRHWALDPKTIVNKSGVWLGELKTGIKYSSGHGEELDGEVEPEFKKKLDEFRVDAKSRYKVLHLIPPTFFCATGVIPK